MSPPYQMLQRLQQHKNQLLDLLDLDNGVSLASWANNDDLVVIQPTGHHTLSLYLNHGERTYLKTPHGWRDGGGPDRLCLMPKDYSSTWNVLDSFEFMHCYFSDAHLRRQAEQTWDKSPTGLSIDEHIFADDAKISSIYRHYLTSLDWHDNANHLLLSSATSLLLNHLVRHYTQFRWQPVTVKGGLAPHQLSRVKAYIDSHLDQALTINELANQAQLSDYHFARMFKHSTGQSPHQYVLQQRLERAQHLLKHSSVSLTDIAQQCGFSSSSHFTHRFRQATGVTPSAYRVRTH
ncbi:AraC family transcriptional regulator [Saccharospirillum sp. HFRX-1]|uniref:AraC family transcriptional regulator n=1 Tax=unclassified Saccharospirillum TaxID=2633430 RepID=UPI00371299E1